MADATTVRAWMAAQRTTTVARNLRVFGNTGPVFSMFFVSW